MKTIQPPTLKQAEHTPAKLNPINKLNDKLDYCFRRFRLGLALFFFGFVILFSVNQLLQPSLQQEILAGLSLVIIAAGFLLAVFAELCFITYRLISFFSSREQSKQ